LCGDKTDRQVIGSIQKKYCEHCKTKRKTNQVFSSCCDSYFRGLTSPFLPRFLGICDGGESSHKIYILNEIGTFKPTMTLKSALKNQKMKTDWPLKVKIALDISQIAVSFHSMQRIPFLDVFNLENFLIDEEGNVKVNSNSWLI
jgi:hypothetical protein